MRDRCSVFKQQRQSISALPFNKYDPSFKSFYAFKTLAMASHSGSILASVIPATLMRPDPTM